MVANLKVSCYNFLFSVFIVAFKSLTIVLADLMTKPSLEYLHDFQTLEIRRVILDQIDVKSVGYQLIQCVKFVL